MAITGCDIANHQGRRFPFVTAFNQGFRFAIIKASGGRYFNDIPTSRVQVEGALAANIAVAFYHYMFEPTSGAGTPEQEWQNFYDSVLASGWRPGMSLWLDVEEYPQHGENMVEWIVRFQEACYRTVGFYPGIYTGTYFIQANGLYDARLTRSPLWLASWQDSIPAAQYWLPWKKLTVWQYDAYYRGVTGSDLDCDSFFGTVAEFQALGENKELGKVNDAQKASDILAGSIGEVKTEVYRRPDGASAPIDVTFHNPVDEGFGIPYRLLTYVYNPDTGHHYLGEWVEGEYKPWVDLNA